MGRSRTTAETDFEPSAEPSLARSLAPEEIRPGDFVALLAVAAEAPSWLWGDAPGSARDELVRFWHWPSDESPPLRVRGVCLPFVMVETASRTVCMLDVRRARLARLDREFAGQAWRAYRKQAERASVPPS